MKKLSIFVVLCLVLIVLTTGVVAACTPSHTCQSTCALCGGCTNADCLQKACKTKCQCDKCFYCKLCKSDDCTQCADKCQCDPLQVTHTHWDILVGKPTQTTVHQIVTNKPGPAVVIVGGTHGDETAGWNAALQLVDEAHPNYLGKMPGVCGQILVIPQANKLSNIAVKRTAEGYTDLNRAFPTERYSTANAKTIEIANAIVQTITEFDIEFTAQYFVDFHEAQSSWTKVNVDTGKMSVGDTLIFDNKQFFMRDVLRHYNKNYLVGDEPSFTTNPASQKGSFSYHFTHTYPDRVVFTIETNRERINGVDTIPLETRVRQQINVMNALFDFAWQRI